MSKTFCALPFQHLCIGPEGTTRVCCVTNDLVSEHGAPMSLNIHTMDEIWNSAYMRNIRRGMLKGERISACDVCYKSEAATGQSYRTTTGLRLPDGQPASRVAMNQYGAKSGFRVDRHPEFIKLEIGNLCNLKCRMCYGAASSQIERDPVHSKWSGGIEPLHAVWRGDVARIGPERHAGVRTSGLHPQEFINGVVRCWTDGHAIFSVPLQVGTQIASLEVSFHPLGIREQDFQIIINGRQWAKGVLESANPPVSIDLRSYGGTAELTIEILSNTIVEAAGEPERGLPLSDVVLRRQSTASSMTMRPQLLSPRLVQDGPWYMDDRKVFEDVLKSANTLQRLYITGGEPLINNRVAEVLEFLVESGEAEHIGLELSTNCTRVDSQTIDRLRKFRYVQLYLSLDGIGDTYEYIRYPARWDAVDANVQKLTEHYGIACSVSPVVQVYNVLRLPELYRYCDRMGMDVTLNILQTPERLAIDNLPPKTRKAAAANLVKYYEEDCGATNKPPVWSLAQYLNELSRPVDPKLVRELMVFTNDLDATRGQSFSRTHSELVQLLAEDGFEWVEDTLHAKSRDRNRPARERIYAWL